MNYLPEVGVLTQKCHPFLNSTEVLLVRLFGVGRSLPRFWSIFQKYDKFDIVSDPKVLPPWSNQKNLKFLGRPPYTLNGFEYQCFDIVLSINGGGASIVKTLKIRFLLICRNSLFDYHENRYKCSSPRYRCTAHSGPPPGGSENQISTFFA